MSQVKDGKPPTSHSKVSELMLALANIKQGQEKHFDGMAFMESHASLFHIICSIVKSFKKTEKHDNTLSESQKSDQICLSVPHDDVIKKGPDSAKNMQEDKDTCTSVHSKHLTVSKSKRDMFRRQQKHGFGVLPPTHLLPYLVLINECIHLPIDVLQNQCLRGKILCRIQYFTLIHRKKKLLPQAAPQKLPIAKSRTTEGVYVTFDSLKDLQWKLYKGLAKRKPKVTGTWREPIFSLGITAIPTPSNAEYILPLMPNDWLVDDSLKYSIPISVLLKPDRLGMQMASSDWKASI
ncbi:uncharacterized protein LOC128345002 [Hemicordylus capensis]|uniref:uncharacterized protein LOC128345002 n=1 Tax=Hemicordylus capensis TaxID=884348 RepID=UPI002303BA11|nr:uncharacterized protein LOC128345002 [Hemicordylus capensis]XP_053152192.1 uncharacterized protein LOC128345002 [Hemicordylus capensis]XP_053152193.1 uncharacterized protein LOC128345002 [Hemicordylus capensis]XP_053152194.1 uncharacterized protein LOC128345002 [Hemicordylus capensis]XP_053152195.1 uncharacterized protein LOC128345002 [Hemicordylus capensis]XP_053152196.1 uncharacterized protein LOC128345002 [Hemicordylus capensis]XP_053152197.1 uncharacterized protein LOC128345002 [Hemico